MDPFENIRGQAKGAADTLLSIIVGMARDRDDAIRGLEAITRDMTRAIDRHFNERKVS